MPYRVTYDLRCCNAAKATTHLLRAGALADIQAALYNVKSIKKTSDSIELLLMPPFGAGSLATFNDAAVPASQCMGDGALV
ncbi:hypothetical protein [Mycetohabitans sp. B3]|nr:hypothetical protein [Mycetohabitans sp. B3]MCF2134033.1 hypothetical protein [Mycetohabitans sp. B3]